jgi:hypothetical protein
MQAPIFIPRGAPTAHGVSGKNGIFGNWELAFARAHPRPSALLTRAPPPHGGMVRGGVVGFSWP